MNLTAASEIWNREQAKILFNLAQLFYLLCNDLFGCKIKSQM